MDKIDEYLNAVNEKVDIFRRALTKETDRGCALFAAAFLDKSLNDLLYGALAESKKIDEDLFSGTAPLSSFSSKIKLAFYLGKISTVERRDLDLIRKIRNDFAHNSEAISFETLSIESQCKGLLFSYHEKEHRARGHFTAASMGLLSVIHFETLRCVSPTVKPDNAPTEDYKKRHREMLNKILNEHKSK